MLHNIRTLGVNIERHFGDVTMFLAEPLNFPIWATGLSEGLAPATQDSGVALDEQVAKATPGSDEGSVFICSSLSNIFGIVDHWARLPDGSTIYTPLRVVHNGAGTTVLLALPQRPNMDGTQFDADVEWVQQDLVKLRTVLEVE